MAAPREWRLSGVNAESLRVRQPAASLMPRARQGPEAVDVDHGQLIGRRLEDVAVVMDLDELAPVGGWAAGGCDRWWLERFAEVGQNLADRARLGDERDEPDVATTSRTLKRKLLPHPGQEFHPGYP